MKTYRVIVATTVEAYGTVKIKARSAKDAERRINKMLDKGDTSLIDAEVVFEPDWCTQDEPRVCPDCTEED